MIYILNYQAISHKSFFDEIRNMSNIKNLYIDNNSDKFLIEHFSE